MTKNQRLAAWQRRLREQPVVILVEVRVTGEVDWEIVRAYESEEAARIEIEWQAAHRCHARMVKMPIHSLRLSRERWLGEWAEPEPGSPARREP